VIPAKFKGKVAVIIGTGPSLTEDALSTIFEYRHGGDHFRLFGGNNVYSEIRLDVHFSCNPEWWEHYESDPVLKEQIRDPHIDQWTWDKATAVNLGINYVEGRWSGGKRNVTSLSQDPAFIHYGHGTGYELLGVAYHYGCRTFILAGYDLRYPRGYSRDHRKPGGARHYFGEYPGRLQHWPKVGPDGEMTGLLDCYRTIDTDTLGLRIINTAPGTALDFFECMPLEKALEETRK